MTTGETEPKTMDHIERALSKAKQSQDSSWLAAVRQPSKEGASTTLKLTRSDLWRTLRKSRIDPDVVHASRLVSLSREGVAHTAFDMLRTRVLHLLRQNKWTSIAITSPSEGCGKTLVALNLAFSLAHQKDCRTLLVDFDLRRPQVAKALGMSDAPSIEGFLKGHIGMQDMFVRYADNVAVAANSQRVEFPAELLQSPETAEMLKNLKTRLAPDVMIFDLPPMLSTDDVLAFLPNVDCVILIAAAEQSTMSEIDLCERQLADATNVLGVVLNKCQFMPEKYGY